MANFVLVPGFWLGAWAWKEVTKLLREKGHEVFPVSLTGLGERVHLGSAETNLDTHVADLVNLIKYNELEDVYLAGHSYAGVVITQAADLIPEKIAKLIYVDTAPLPDGTALIDFYQPAVREEFEKSVESEGDGWLLPLPPKDSQLFSQTLKDVSDEAWARFENLATPQPFNVAYQKLSLKNPQRRALPKLAVLSSFSTAQVKELIASGAPLFQELADPNFEFADLPTGHYPMFSRPRELAELLDKAVK
jgi:pimeloyl-ACP methyl ester carboxylesterase